MMIHLAMTSTPPFFPFNVPLWCFRLFARALPAVKRGEEEESARQKQKQAQRVIIDRYH